MKYHGDLRFGRTPSGREVWQFDTDPEAGRRIRSILPGKANQFKLITIDNTPQNCVDIEWIVSRYPHRATPSDITLLMSIVSAHKAAVVEAEELFTLTDLVGPVAWNAKFPPRFYQLQGAEFLKLAGRYVLGDDMGLGKTITALIAAASAECRAPGRPTLVVCQAHVQEQWREQVAKFCPGMRTHIIERMKEYAHPRADLLIITYSKLEAWCERLKPFFLVADECQELRKGTETKKGGAFQALARQASFAIGLSHTPAYNYAGEFYHVIDCISPGALGTHHEFLKEWADGNEKGIVKDPAALGAFLRSNRLYLRRTKRDVGRELPPVLNVTEIIEYKADVLARFQGEAVALAKTILTSKIFTEKGQASRALDIKLRQATAIAKAPYAADFIRNLLTDGRKIVVGAWHREVYKVLEQEFKLHGIGYVLYTGEESPADKVKAVKRFRGELPPETGKPKPTVFVMSLRSGAGLDGLQDVTETVVYVELDWSPKVHEQFTGRVSRDGQDKSVTAIYLIAETGSDPVIAGVLGLKDANTSGVMNPDEYKALAGEDDAALELVETSRAKALATSILSKK